MIQDYFMSGKFYINGDNGEKVLSGYFSVTAGSDVGITETFKQMFDAVVNDYKVHPKMVCVEQFNKV